MSGRIESTVTGAEAAVFFGVSRSSLEMTTSDFEIWEVGEGRSVRSRPLERHYIVSGLRTAPSDLIGREAIVDQFLYECGEAVALLFRDIEAGSQMLVVCMEVGSAAIREISTGPGIDRVVFLIRQPPRWS